MSSAFFNIARPIAPRLIQCLYYIALVLIALGLLRGLVGGVQMLRAPAPVITASAPSTGPQGQSAEPPAVAPGAGQFPGPRRPGMRRRGFGGPLISRPGPAFLRGAAPPLRAGAFIFLVLLRAVIGWMVVRILAEIGATILSLRDRPA